MSSHARRTFLTQAGLTAASLMALPGTAQAAPLFGEGVSADRLLAAAAEWDAQQSQQAEPWDVSWPKRLTGKHKAMFDVPEVEGGVGVMRAGIWQRQYADVLKTQPGDLSTVIVVRHNGIFLGMNQEFWTTYEVGKAEKLKGDDGKTLKHNPVLPTPGQDAPASMRALMLDKQIENGAIVLGCGLAYRSVVGMIQQRDKLDAAEARKKANSMLVPGLIMQPSGIFANVMAEENGCAFVYAV
jgi:hypothetical protein